MLSTNFILYHSSKSTRFFGWKPGQQILKITWDSKLPRKIAFEHLNCLHVARGVLQIQKNVSEIQQGPDLPMGHDTMRPATRGNRPHRQYVLTLHRYCVLCEINETSEILLLEFSSSANTAPMGHKINWGHHFVVDAILSWEQFF